MKSEMGIFEDWKYCGLLINKKSFLQGVDYKDGSWKWHGHDDLEMIEEKDFERIEWSEELIYKLEEILEE